MDSLSDAAAGDANLGSDLWKIAWPAVTMNLIHVVNGLMDRVFIGHLPEAALAGMGGSMSFIFLMFSLAFSLAVGAGAIVARAYGAKNPDEYNKASQQSLRFGFFTGLALWGLSFALIPLLALSVFKSSQGEAAGYMKTYLYAFCLGIPMMTTIQVITSCLRSVGNTRTPMLLSIGQIGSHIVLNYLFIFPPRNGLPGFGWGIQGAALAFAASNLLAVFGYIWAIRHSELGTHFSFKLPEMQWVKRILRIAVPSALHAVLRTSSFFVFTLLMSRVPTSEAALAALGFGITVESLMFAPSFGLSVAVGALVGQSLGAKNTSRAEKVGWIGGGWSFFFTAIVSVIIFFAVPTIADRFLHDKPTVAHELTLMIRALCFTEPLFCLSMVMIGGLQGAGDTKAPIWITVATLWLLRLPLGAWLALGPSMGLAVGLGMGSLGCWVAMSVTQGLGGIMSAWWWKQGKWKTTVV